ncbi:MAG: RimK family alpha-L-glutamate ligase [Candidatus Marsarchaeota archaeon]|nr:RimK family alpha-L-glutamate ligase [Candidatus Marsarchaeota archaeon]MCL5413370.1 RimK family alpha-L-glutamate ligase [Candidatus Marsarchaeota archaeon]
MDIGVITPSNSTEGSETKDIISAIRKSGNTPVPINIQNIVVKIGRGGVVPHCLSEFTKESRIDLDCAVFRHIGIINDYEQFGQRIWAVRSMEMNGMRTVNNILSWVRASDKLGTLMELSAHGIRVPQTMSGESFFSGYAAVKEFGSAVVKPLRSGKGLGVFKVDDPDVAMHIFSYFTNLSKPIYVQKYLDKVGGGDYRVVVVGGGVIGAEYRKGTGWKSNVAQGAKARAVKPSAELSELAIKAAEAMGLDYAGVDIAETKGGYFVLETNPTVAWAAFKKTTGINPAEHIVRHAIRRSRL